MPLPASVQRSAFVCKPCGALLMARAAAAAAESPAPRPAAFSLSPSQQQARVFLSRGLSTSPHPRVYTLVPHVKKGKPSIQGNIRKNAPPLGSGPIANFTLDDVPPLSFWQARAKAPWVREGGPSPADCHRAAHEYVRLAVEGTAHSPAWYAKLGSWQSSWLYYAAITIMNSGRDGRAYPISWHMLYSLVMADYRPAILTTVRFALRVNKLGMPSWTHAEKAFLKMMREDMAAKTVNPNAATLAGLLAAKFASERWPPRDRAARDLSAITEVVNLISVSSQPSPLYPGGQVKASMHAKSLEWMRLAAVIGGEKPGAWDWQISCATCMAQTYGEKGDTTSQAKIYEYLAKTLDNPDGCYIYAKSLAPGSPEREDLMLKSALSGVVDATMEMADTYRSRAKDAAKQGTSDTRHLSIMASEWEAIVRAMEPTPPEPTTAQ